MLLLTLAKQVHCWLPLTMIHRIFLIARNWSKRITWLNIPQLKLGDILRSHPRDIPQYEIEMFPTTAALRLKFNSIWENIWWFSSRREIFVCSYSRARENWKENTPCSKHYQNIFFFTHVAKYLKDRKRNKLCFPRKHAVFVLEHYLGMFLKAYSLSQTSLSENRSDYRCRITANCTITLSDYNWAEWLVKNKAANAPITF